MIRRTLLLPSLLALAAAQCAEPLTQGGLTPCTLPNIPEPLRCGTLVVPEVRGVRDGRTIALRVVVVPAARPDPAPDPWVELVGGPGNAATDFAAAFVGDLSYARRDRDVLLVDQRGTGGSHPLYCEELALHQISSLPARFPLAAVAACRARLAAEADLSAYSTAAAAEDLEAVRRWLGYPRLNLFGSSYGTRVALEYLRRYPTRTRSAILWGVVPPGFRRPRFYPRDGQRALDRLIEECERDPACASWYPRLRGDLGAMWARLEGRPVPVSFRHPATGDTVTTAITPAGVAQVIWNALSYPDRARRLPFAIHRAATGDFSALQALDLATVPPRRRYHNAMHLSVVCGEEVLQSSAEELEAASAGSFMPPDRGLEYLAACREWGVRPVDPGTLGPVGAAVPTLIVSGELDPITPPSWGDEVARGLPLSRHLVVPYLAHEASGLRGAECLDSLFAGFVATPDPAALVVDCVATIRPPAFERPDRGSTRR